MIKILLPYSLLLLCASPLAQAQAELGPLQTYYLEKKRERAAPSQYEIDSRRIALETIETTAKAKVVGDVEKEYRAPAGSYPQFVYFACTTNGQLCVASRHDWRAACSEESICKERR